MLNTPPIRHQALAGAKLVLFADNTPEVAGIVSALVEHGAVVEHIAIDSQWWLREFAADLAIVRIEHSLTESASRSAAERNERHLLQTLAQTRRIVGLLDAPPEVTLPGLYDFVLPPFRPDEVIPRVARALGEAPPSMSVRAGNLELNLASRTVSIDGKVIDLTFHEFEILRTLLAAHGAVLTRDDLMRRVWGEEMSIASRRMDIHIHRLRTKLRGMDGAAIDTVRNVGYRLTVRP